MIGLCERALTRLAVDDPLRVRVLATLASHLTFASEPAHGMALIAEALELAHRHRDPALLGAVLNAEFICLRDPGTLDRREQIAISLTEIAFQTQDAELEYIGGFFSRSLGELALALGRTEEAIELLASAIDDADTIGMPFESVISRRLLAGALLREDKSIEATTVIDDALAVARARGFEREARLLEALSTIDR